MDSDRQARTDACNKYYEELQKAKAQITQLETENHDITRKLGILEKEAVACVTALRKESGKSNGCYREENARDFQPDFSYADNVIKGFTAIATLLEQP